MKKLTIQSLWYDVLAYLLENNAVARVLLYGPPDTGKTTTATKLAPAEKTFRVQCSKQQGIEDLLGSFVLQNGETKFIPGPVPRAMESGGVLIADEFDMRNSMHDSVWHAVLDDASLAAVRLPTGDEVKAAPGFRVICTTNALPQSFSPALQRRFEVKLWCGQAHPDALKHLPIACASMLRNWQKSSARPETKIETSVSSLSVFARLSSDKGIGQDIAAALVFHNSHAEFLSVLASNTKTAA